MQISRKIGYVTFVHDENFAGDVEIRKGDAKVLVSINTLRAFVAESIRSDEIERVRRMKPEDLLRRLA